MARFTGFGLAVCVFAATSCSKAPPTPDEVLRRVSDYYRQANVIHVESEQATRVQTQGMDNTMTVSRLIIAEKPNKLLIQSESGMMAPNIYCDGARLFTHLPGLETYTETAAPSSFEDILGDPIASGGSAGMFVMQLFASDPYAAMMEGVTHSEYAGAEQISGSDVHHLKFTQDQFDWELWVDAGEAPVVHRVRIDMSKSLGQLPLPGAQAGNMQSIVTEAYSNWKFNEPAPPGAFAFSPPAGTSKSGGAFQQLQAAFAQAFQSQADAGATENAQGQVEGQGSSDATSSPILLDQSLANNVPSTAASGSLPLHQFAASPPGGQNNIRAIVSPESRTQQQWEELASTLAKPYANHGGNFFVNFFSNELALEGWSGTRDVTNKDRPVWLAWVLLRRQGVGFTPMISKIVSDDDRRPLP